MFINKKKILDDLMDNNFNSSKKIFDKIKNLQNIIRIQRFNIRSFRKEKIFNRVNQIINNNCPICLDDFTLTRKSLNNIIFGSFLRYNNKNICGHIFHMSCLMKMYGVDCPICRNLFLIDNQMHRFFSIYSNNFLRRMNNYFYDLEY